MIKMRNMLTAIVMTAAIPSMAMAQYGYYQSDQSQEVVPSSYDPCTSYLITTYTYTSFSDPSDTYTTTDSVSIYNEDACGVIQP